MKATGASLAELISLKGSLALITGSAMGIGKATALRYAEAGADLLLLDINEQKLNDTAAYIRNTHDATVTTSIVDLADLSAIERFLQSLDRVPDILVNNAGIFFEAKLEELTNETFERMLHVNTRAAVFLCKGIIARRGHKGGTIVNISSIEGLRGMTSNLIAYGVSKAGVLGISRAIVHDYARHGWKANTILPGGICTPGMRTMGATALKHFELSIIMTGIKFSSRLPTGKMGSPDDVARVALFLGSHLSDYMNGAEVAVDGGFLAM